MNQHKPMPTYESALSAEVQATTLLSAPTLDAVTTDATSAALAWTATYTNGNTRVEYRDTDDVTWITDQTVGFATETATISGLDNGTTYDFRVVAETPDAESPSNAVTETTTLPDESPATITTSDSNTIDVERSGTPSNNGGVRAQLIDPNNNVLEENVVSYSTTTTSFSPLADGERYFVRTRTETNHVTGAWATAFKNVSRNSNYYGAGSVSVVSRSAAKARDGTLAATNAGLTNSRALLRNRDNSYSVLAAGLTNSVAPLSKSRAGDLEATGGVASTGSIFNEVFPSENSDDLSFNFIFDPFLAFASEWVEDESVFGDETDAFTVILDAYINDYITIRIQYRAEPDGRIYTTEPRKVTRNAEVESFEELGDPGQYRLLLSDMSLDDHLRVVTWGPTRY